MRYRSTHTLGPEHVGRRVTVRRVLHEGGRGDVLGTLLRAEDAFLVVRTDAGDEVEIERAEIVAARAHPPPRPR